MNLEIILEKKVKILRLNNLKGFIIKSNIKSLKDIYVKQEDIQEGDMGMGEFTNSLIAIIEAASSPICELIICLQEYIKLFEVEIEVKIDSKHIRIKGKNPERLEKLIKNILIEIDKDYEDKL